jgi:hypothetical protein
LEEGEEIEFSGDDLIKKYQIMRTTTPPKNYRDFSNATLLEESTSLGEINIDSRANAASYVDTIKSNTKYYYIFRCVDIHDQISNPTEVFQVEIINDAGSIYSKIEPYSFPKDENKQSTKDLKRFLMIKPNALQRYMELQYEDLETYEQFTESKIRIGVKQNSILNKKYKLRVVSKNTNKVYDINFSFGKTVKFDE